MPDMSYDEQTYTFGDGDVMVLTSDGITEAHSPEREMYGFARLMGQVGKEIAAEDMCAELVGDLERWTGADAEQEDDITLVVIRRTESAQASADAFEASSDGKVLTTFSVASEEGNERDAIAKVVEAVDGLGLEASRLERLKTAVGETVMNSIEHGNENRAELPVDVSVAANDKTIRVRVTDRGGSKVIPEAHTPDLEAKLAGEQTPRGWGLFLVEKMVDEVKTERSGETHTIELVMNMEGE